MPKNQNQLPPALPTLNAKYAAAVTALLADVTPSEADAITEAALRYTFRRDRAEHPSGKTDNAGRWYPHASEKLDTSAYRAPSRAWPWSYMHACRTIAHCARLEGVPQHVSKVRRLARQFDLYDKEIESDPTQTSR